MAAIINSSRNDLGQYHYRLNNRQRANSFVNLSGEEIPAYAAMEIVAVDKEETLYVTKPTRDDMNFVVLNGPSKVPVDGHGVFSNHMPTWAYYNIADTAPANGESVGTRAGFWHLNLGYEGFKVWGGARDGIVFVQRDMTCRTLRVGGYYYGEEPCGTRCCCWRCGENRDTNPYDVTGFTGPTTIRATVTTPCIGTPDTDSVDMVISFCGCNTLPSPCTDPPGDYYDQITWTGQTVDTVSGGCNSCVPPHSSFTWADTSRLTCGLTCVQAGLGSRWFFFHWNHIGDSGAVVNAALLVGGGFGGGGFMCNPFRWGPITTGHAGSTPPGTGFACFVPGPGQALCQSCVGGYSTILLEQV